MKERNSHQTGHIFRSGRFWYGRWRRKTLVAGEDGESRIESKQHCEKLVEYGDRYRSRRDVQPLLDAKLRPVNEGKCSAEATLTVAEYGDKFFLPYADRELKPSTANGYRGLWRMYLRPRLTDINLIDFRCVDASGLLAALHSDHKLSRKSLRNCKGLLSSIFTHAMRAGVLDRENPVQKAGIPRAAESGKPTHAYSVEEIMAMFNVLDGVPRLAVALMYFTGLRPGEARAARWEDYDAKRKALRVSASMWRLHVTSPKTPESVAPVPVGETLAEMLGEVRKESGFILCSPTGKAVDLHNLAFREVKPALAKCANCRQPKAEHGSADHEFQPLPKWRGWYALRRGCATLATSVDSQMAAKSLLRHSNIATTQAHYIKSVPSEAVRAVEKMDALFQKSNVSATPN